MKKLICIIFVILVMATGIIAQTRDFLRLTGPYLVQKMPGMMPEIFAPGIITTEYHEHSSPVFSPDGRKIIFESRRPVHDGNPYTG